MSRVLVTGGAGFIGTNLVKKLERQGHDVYVIDNFHTGKEENKQPRVHYIEKDLLDIELDLKVDRIFHLAALSRIQPSFNNPDDTFQVNVLGTQKILEYARLIGAKVIYAGSSSKHHNPYQSPYAATKFIGEQACKMYKKTYGMDIEIARFYNVYGPYEITDSQGGWAAVIGVWRYCIENNLPLPIVGDGNQKRDFTHVDDIVDGLYRIGFKTKKHEDAWELGSGVNYSINEVYQLFKEYMRKNSYINSISLPDEPGNYKSTLRVNNDAIERLNWKPKDRLKDYIKSL